MKTIEKYELLYKVEARDNILYLVYNKSRWGLCDMFKTDDLVGNYIHNSISEAYDSAVKKIGNKEWLLNIASTEDYGAFKDDIPDKNILEYQLSVYMPLIQKFMVDVLTDNL